MTKPAIIPRACVIGHPVAQSRSPLLHGFWLRQYGIAGAYGREDVAPDGFAEFFAGFRSAGYVGGNVTAPHKVNALRAVSRLDAAARAIGAVNTIWLEGEDWVGGNTDAHGFIANLDDGAPSWDVAAKVAVVLGAGGATRAILYALRERGIGVVLVNRTQEAAQALAAEFNLTQGPRVSVLAWEDIDDALSQADLLVNATVLGMQGKPAMEIDLAALMPAAVVYDIVYVPLETGLLLAAKARGHRVVDGLGMLLHQAVPGFQRWFGFTPSVTPELRRLIEADIRATTAKVPA